MIHPSGGDGEPEFVRERREDDLAGGEEGLPTPQADVSRFSSRRAYLRARLRNRLQRGRDQATPWFAGSEPLADDAMTANPTIDSETGIIRQPVTEPEAPPSPGRRAGSREGKRRSYEEDAPEPNELSAEASIFDVFSVNATVRSMHNLQRPIAFTIILIASIIGAAALVFLGKGLGMAAIGVAVFILVVLAIGLWYSRRPPEDHEA